MSPMATKSLPPSKFGFTSVLIGKLKNMVEHGIRKLTVFQNVPTAEIDRFIKTVGPELRDAWLELVKKRFQAFIGRFCLLVDYDLSNAIAKAIEEAGFDWKYLGLSPEDMPLVGTGQVEHEVHEVHFGKVMYNRDLPNALKERGKALGFPNGFKFADVLTAIRYACALPDQQRKYPLGILFTDAKGRLWCLYLHEDGRERYLLVYRRGPVSHWDESVRFLVVCA